MSHRRINNGKVRRERKAALHVKGPSGQPNPAGNRAYRRSDQYRDAIRQLADKIRGMAA